MATGARAAIARRSLIQGGLLLLLGACGGGGSNVASTPTPSPTPTPTVNYNTAEYQRSNGPVQANAIAAYNAGASGAGVTVGVIDTGLSDPTGELAGRISAASRDFSGSGTIADAAGHGTEVAMTIAASRNGQSTLGIAWGATIMALRADQGSECVSDTTCKFSQSTIANAMDHAVANGARVVNISLGGPSSAGPGLLAAVSRATSAGTIIVIGSGNDSAAAPDLLAQSLANPTYSHGLVIITEALTASNMRASFSNGALGFETVTLGALGVGVNTIDRTGAAVSVSGTSFSTPLVSGAAALLAQAFPTLSSAQIVQLLLSSARDAGATGADAEFGMGILDLSRAFAPQGTLSLAGTTTTVSTSAVGALSSAMGDAAAASQSLTGVATDTLGRAYQVALGGSLRLTTPAPELASVLDVRMQGLSGSIGGGTGRIAVSLAPSSLTAVSPELGAQPTRIVSARMVSQPMPGMMLAMGFRTGEGSLRGMMGQGPSEPSFLMARNTGSATDEFRPDRSMRIGWRIARGLNAVATSEMGRVGAPRRPDAPLSLDQGRYDSMGFGVEGRRGLFSLSTIASYVTERGTALGARFTPLMGAQSARTVFADVRLALDAGGWTLGGAWRRGWTRAAAGGALRDGGGIDSQSWNVTAGRQQLLGASDRIDLRLARPLRVVGSAFALTLPTAWDYSTGTATDTVQTLDLRPRGREQIVEAAYGAPVGEGWLTANVYRRSQPGNIAMLPSEMGGALRYSLTF